MYNYTAYIKEVYDGDTVKAIVDLGFLHYQEMTLELYGIDSSELGEEERNKGVEARDVLRDLILNKEVEIHTFKDKRGKFGRYLATVVMDGLDINQWLVQNGHAQEYLL